MEHLFQADINGSLERLERIESGLDDLEIRSPSDIILCSLKATLDMYASERHFALDPSSDQLRVQQECAQICHTALFNAWIKRKDALTSFSVSRYPRGVLPGEYYQIMEALNMGNNFKLSMYSLNPETAAVAFQELLPHIEPPRLYDYLPTYLRICNGIDNEQLYDTAISHMCSTLTNCTPDAVLIQQLLSSILGFYTSNLPLSAHHFLGYHQILLLLYDTSSNIISETLPHTWNTLIGVMQGKKAGGSNWDIPQPFLVMTEKYQCDMTGPPQSAISSRISDLWDEAMPTLVTPYERHEYAFKLITAMILRDAVPSQYNDNNENEINQPSIKQWTSSCNTLTRHMSSVALEKKTDISSPLFILMERCLKWLTERRGSWKSIIKVMTQFADIWIRVLATEESMLAFADLIVLANTWTTLYRLVVNIINVPTEIVTQRQKGCLSHLVHLVIERLETSDLLQLIYETYPKRSFPTDQAGSSPAQLDLFDDMAALKKCCNQFVQSHPQDDQAEGFPDNIDQVEPRILNQLAKLAALSPFITLSKLVNQGLENKGQHGLVVSILRQLGDLCMLQRYPDDKTLIGHILHERVLSMTHQYKGLEMLVPILFECWRDARNPNTPILLDSYTALLSNVSGTQILVHPKELFDGLLLPALGLHGAERPLAINIMGLLNALTGDTSTMATKWQRHLQQHVSYLPLFLEMDFDILMDTITVMMDKRYSNVDEATNVPGLSMAMDLGRKLMMTIEHVFNLYESVPEQIRLVKTKLCHFYDTLDAYDWRTRLFWEKTYQYTDKHENRGTCIQEPPLMGIPHTSTSVNLANDQEWRLILNGCRSSSSFTDTLFKCMNDFKDRLGPIWTHPHDSIMFREHLIRNLHPSFFVATHFEYALLLGYFLDRLYDAFGDHQVVRLYDYEDENVKALVGLLTDERK
ncbi:hypothetical protein [Absidia glauca]|uniref:Uncharacterized protein n=1 Tax=Absidia glauca TaxID=4829 RepID=A0A168R5J8_ABSGL|nr:hypothetical protein [Absidia glauca]